MTGAGQRVAIITGGPLGISAGLVAAYRRRDWAVVANSRTIKPSEDGAVLTISGDISQPATTSGSPAACHLGAVGSVQRARSCVGV
jgi:NAD(P)-dependent dehydrogenase (short-subunit alcohol dehydrogenase family)